MNQRTLRQGKDGRLRHEDSATRRFARLRVPASPRLLAVLAVILPLYVVRAQETKPAEVQRAPISIVEAKRTDPVDFEKEILPVLKNNCLACHNQTKAKADLVLETPQTILKGGESGPAVVAGKSGESLLLRVASHQEKRNMPPKDNKVNAADLTPEQLGLIKRWIDQGAQGEVRASAAIEWGPLPEGMNPIYAVALTPDGQFAACGRANQIFIYHIPSGQLVTRLSDPRLGAWERRSMEASERENAPTLPRSGVAHLDLVHSLAFSPDANLLASGGYREVKLWRRPRNVQKRWPIADGPLPSDKGISSVPAQSAMGNLQSGLPQAIAASADGKWLATGGADGSIKLWDAASGTEKKLMAGELAVIGLKFSPNSARLCSGAADHTLRVWTVPDGGMLVQTNLSAEMTNAHPFAMTWVGGKQIATGGADRLIRLWQIPDGTNGQISLVRDLKGHEGAITCLDTVPPGEIDRRSESVKASEGQSVKESQRSTLPRSHAPTLLLSGSADGSLRLWNLETGETVREMKHGGPVTAVAVRGDGKLFASAGLNNVAKLWRPEDGKLVAEMKGDRYAQELLAETERTVSAAASELSYRTNAFDAADKQQKSSTERLGKANEAFASADKTFGEKQKQLQGAAESKTGVEKEIANLNSELKKVTEDYQAADKTAKQAAAEAKAAIETAAQARLLADQAAQTKIDTERIGADAAAVASKSKAAAGSNLADSIKAAAERMAAAAAAMAEKARAFAESAAQDAAAKSKRAAEAKTAAEKAIDEVAAKSFAVGQMKPRLDKLTAESPDKIKQAGGKLAAATNALASADQEFKKAEQAKSSADQELQLARTAAQQASDAVAQARTAIQFAEGEQKKTEAEMRNAKKIIVESEKPIRTIAFSPDQRVLATAGDDQKVHTWSAETGAPFETFTGPTSTVFSVAFAAADTLLAGSLGQRLVVWDLNPAWTLERTIGTGGPNSPILDRVNAIRFSPDGKWLASGGGEPSRSGEIILWKIADGGMEKEFRTTHSDTVLAVDFSPDGKYLASGAADKFVKVIELTTGKVVKSFEGHLHHVLGVSWKRDGRTLASSGADNVVKIWDFVTGERKKNIEGFNKEVTSISFIEATDQALASSGDNQVRLMRENGEDVRTFGGATDYVYSAVATPDGKIVAAGGQDSMLRVWNGLDGKPITSFPPPETK